MTKVPATNLENSSEALKTPENPPPQEAPENPVQPEARKRGRPAGSKDRAPRRKIKIEPFPEPVEMTPPSRQQAALAAPATSAPPKAPPKAPPRALPKEVPAPPRERTPSPPTPRTLYRQTSEHLINLRDIMNQQKRTAAAERYTSNLHSWIA